MKCVHAKKKSYKAFTKNLINQILNTLSFDHIVLGQYIRTVYMKLLIKFFHIGAKNKARIRKNCTLLNLLAFDLSYFRLHRTQIKLKATRHLHSYNALLIF